LSWFSKINSTFFQKAEGLTNGSSPLPYMGRKFLVEPMALEPRVLFDGAGLYSSLEIDIEVEPDDETKKAEITNNTFADATVNLF
jgi:hypothetical protein